MIPASFFKHEDEGRLMQFARRFDFKRLHRDQTGNVMVLYIAAALLLVAMLWAIIGTGARLVQKETLQSSADAAAFSAAAIRAKGMNIIAFCNLLMALLLAIIIIIRLLKAALWIAAGLLIAASFFAPPLASLAATVTNVAKQFDTAAQKIEDGILKAMKGIGKFERGVAKVTPALSLVEAWRVGTNGAYKKNMGDGAMVTLALPLPVGKDVSLPVKDGTWDKLCDEAKKSMGRILKWILEKVVGSTAAGWVEKGFNKIASPFVNAVCGGGGSVSQQPEFEQLVQNCGECASADGSKVQEVKFTGVRKDNGASEDVVLGSFPSSLDCGDNAGMWNGVEYTSLKFQGCSMTKASDVDMNATIGDKPLPLELDDDWKQRTQIRAFTVLTGTKSSERRQSVGIARKGGAGGNPLPLDALMTMAQAEYCSWNGHDDLWHMDWRARLVPFTFGGDTSGNDTGDTTGTVSSGALQSVRDKLGQFMGSEEGQTLTKQFLIH